MTRLRHVDSSAPGWTRRRCGRGFAYFDEHGQRLGTEAVARVRALAIPPAWTEVWICPRPNGHLQATGTDAAGRKQYLYHPHWRVQRDRDKFDRMLVFARALPRLRTQVRRDLDSGDLTREQVLACAAHSVVDPTVSAIVSRLKSRRGGGQELLAFRAAASRPGRHWIDVTSEDINSYLKAATGVACSAKDFRTWNATVLATVALAVGAPAASPSTRARRVRAAVAEVAHYLGNTPAVARSSYIDHRVVDRYLAGDTIAVPPSAFGRPAEPGGLWIQGPIEEAVVALLEDSQAQLAA